MTYRTCDIDCTKIDVWVWVLNKVSLQWPSKCCVNSSLGLPCLVEIIQRGRVRQYKLNFISIPDDVFIRYNEHFRQLAGFILYLVIEACSDRGLRLSSFSGE